MNGTTYQTTLTQLFPERVIVVKATSDLAAYGLQTGDCNVIAGGTSDVSLTQIRNVGNYTGPFQTGSNRFSKDPLALVTRQDDTQFSSFIYWIVSGIFYANEQNITQATAETMPASNAFSQQYARLFRDSVAAVGSYAEIYQRNVQADLPRGGPNLLNVNPIGPEQYPLPGLPT